MRINTFDTSGNPSGWVHLLWNALECNWRPDQVYATVVLPGCRKGPHKHLKRCGRFFCVSGVAEIRVRHPNGYADHTIGPIREGELLVDPGQACAIYNWADEPAIIINMPSPAWSREDPDEHPVTDWDDPEGWGINA